MSEEQPTTAPEQPAEQAQPATPEATEPKPETPQQPVPTVPMAAYVGLQRTINKLHSRNESLARQNVELAEAVKAVKETTQLLANNSLGEDAVKALEERQRVAAERAAALQAAKSLEESVQATIGLVDRVMASAGLSEEDRKQVYLGAKNAGDISEWTESVHAIAAERIAKAMEAKVKEAEGKVTAKDAAAIRAEAEALIQRKTKTEGADKIDTSKGTAPTRLADRLRDMDPKSDEFKKLYADVLANKVVL